MPRYGGQIATSVAAPKRRNMVVEKKEIKTVHMPEDARQQATLRSERPRRALIGTLENIIDGCPASCDVWADRVYRSATT